MNMPAIVGPIKLNNSGGIVHFGDTLNVSPKSSTKSMTGSGGSITGDFVLTNNLFNLNQALDPDLVDQINASVV